MIELRRGENMKLNGVIKNTNRIRRNGNHRSRIITITKKK